MVRRVVFSIRISFLGVRIAMADQHSAKGRGADERVSDALLEQLRRVLVAHAAPDADVGEVSRAIRAVALEARAKGVHAEQLVRSLKEVFESLTLNPPLAFEDRMKRLSQLVTICVREYYAPTSADHPTN